MGQEFEDRRVLLVEDDALTLTLLESVIRTFGFHTYSAASATEAKVALTSFDPDLAILDIDLGPRPHRFGFCQDDVQNPPSCCGTFSLPVAL